MITSKHRFHGYGSLKYVYRNGQTVRSPFFSLKTVANSKRTSYRLAVVVSRKVHKSAVIRNRIRRRLYEAMRSLEPELKESRDMVLTVFSEKVSEVPYESLVKQLRSMLSQSGMLG